MKAITISLVFLFCFSFAEGQNWQWLNRIGGNNVGTVNPDERIVDVATDSLGNSYVCGVIRTNPYINGTAPLLSYGNGDGFVAKFNCSGFLVWYRVIGCSSTVDGFISMDFNGTSLYLSGKISSDFFNYGNFFDTIIDANNINYFFVKLDTSGNKLNQYFIGGILPSCGATIKSSGIDQFSNIYFEGYNDNGCDLFPGTTISTPASYSYLAKLDSNLIPVWYRTEGYNTNVFAVDEDGNMFLSGFYSDTIIIHSDTLFPLDSTGSGEFLLLKYDSTGNYLWSYSNGVPFVLDLGGAIKIDPNTKHIWVASKIGKDGVWGTDTVKNANYFNNNSVCALIEFDQSGTVLNEYNGFSENGLDWPFIDIVDNFVYYGGSNSGWFVLGNDSVQSIGQRDIFVARVNSTSGQQELVASFSGTGSREQGFTLTHDADSNMFLSGSFNGTLDFNGSTYTYIGGFSDAFIAKFGNANCGTVGIDDFNNSSSEFVVYPNPFSRSITVDNPLSKTIEIQICDLSGRRLQQNDLYSTLNTIDLEELCNGMYFISFLDDKKILNTLKIVKANKY